MVGELFAGLGAFKAMFDLAKGLKDINDATTRNTVAIELQEKILTAQEHQAALIETVRSLEEEVAHLKAWGAEKERYELAPIGEVGALAYTLKEDVEPPEPPHQLCASCYNDGKKSVLQKELRHSGRAHLLVCHRCKAEIYTFGMEFPGSVSRRR